jgi:hypothetical protein
MPVAQFLFVVVLLAAWAGTLWMAPIRPPVWGAYWLPAVLVGLVVALLLLAAAEPVRRPPRSAEVAQAEEEGAAGVAFGIFSWVLVIALVVAIAVGYAAPPRSIYWHGLWRRG